MLQSSMNTVFGRRSNATMSESEVERIFHTFSSQERYVLINLAEQILELLGQASVSRDPLHEIVGISGNELPPDDPVLKRLLPSAYQELQDAAEFRRYTEDALRSKKRDHARRIREMLLDAENSFAVERNDSQGLSNDSDEEHVFVHGDQELEMSAIRLKIEGEDIWAWLGGLNDIRLALAVRLDIGGPMMGDLPNDQHRASDLSGSDSRGAGQSDVDGEINQDETKRFQLMAESDPMKAVFAVYSWLGWLQEEFLRQME